MDKATFGKFLLLLIICWSVIPTLTTSYFESNSLLWFICLYCIAAYIRLYGLKCDLKSIHFFLLFLTFSLLSYFSCVIFMVLGTKWKVFAEHVFYFYNRQSVLTLLRAICLFMAFKNLKLKYHKWINSVASATLGVYLIHENEFVRKVLWNSIFKVSSFQNSNFIVLYSIIVTMLIFVICIIVDRFRQLTFERVFIKIIELIKKFYIKKKL